VDEIFAEFDSAKIAEVDTMTVLHAEYLPSVGYLDPPG
jgi:hypothetical protein